MQITEFGILPTFLDRKTPFLKDICTSIAGALMSHYLGKGISAPLKKLNIAPVPEEEQYYSRLPLKTLEDFKKIIGTHFNFEGIWNVYVPLNNLDFETFSNKEKVIYVLGLFEYAFNKLGINPRPIDRDYNLFEEIATQQYSFSVPLVKSHFPSRGDVEIRHKINENGSSIFVQSSDSNLQIVLLSNDKQLYFDKKYCRLRVDDNKQVIFSYRNLDAKTVEISII